MQIISEQQDLSRGIISTKARGRTDVDFYKKSVKDSNNFIVTKYGSAVSRPGTRYIASAVTSSVNRLETFKYSDNIAYCLEFGTNKLRFLTNSAVVTDQTDFTDGTFTSGIDSWNDLSSGTGAISHATNVLRLVGGGVGNEARAGYTFNYMSVNQYTVTLDVITTDVTYKVGTTEGGTEIGTGTLTVGTSKTFNFTASSGGTVYITFEQAAAATTDIDNISLSSPEYVISHSYNIGDVFDLQTTQSFDVMYITNKSYKPKKLTRYGNDDWELTDVTTVDGPYIDINSTTTTVTPGATSGSGVTLTFSSTTGINNNQGFSANDVGRHIRIRSGPDDTDAITYTSTAGRTVFTIPFSYGVNDDVEVYVADATTYALTLQVYTTNYTINSLGQVVFGVSPGAVPVIIRRANTGTGRWGWGTIASVTSSTVVTVDIEESWHGTNATTDWRLGAWYVGNYPVSCVFHEQRLYYIGSGNWVWASQIGDYDNFQPDDPDRKGNPTDATAMYWQIASTEGNELQTLVSKQGLAIFSNGDVSGLITDIGSVLTPLNQPTITKQAEASSALIRPIIRNSEVLFINSLKSTVSSLRFDYNSFGYQIADLSGFSENLFTDTSVIQSTYQTLPHKLIWLVKDDGTMISFSYMQEYGVSAFMKHNIAGTDAKVLSATSVPSGLDNDHLYLLVERTINSSTVRYIERLEDFFDNNDLYTECRFVDSGVYYSGVATSTITGLSHLEGEEVRVFTENGVKPNATVSSGQITLTEDATDVVVGLCTSRNITTHPVYVTISSSSSSKGYLKSIHSIGVELYETAGCQLGTSSDNLTELIFTVPTELETNAYQLFTGYKSVTSVNAYDEFVSVYIELNDPVPITVNSIIIKYHMVPR